MIDVEVDCIPLGDLQDPTAQPAALSLPALAKAIHSFEKTTLDNEMII